MDKFFNILKFSFFILFINCCISFAYGMGDEQTVFVEREVSSIEDSGKYPSKYLNIQELRVEKKIKSKFHGFLCSLWDNGFKICVIGSFVLMCVGGYFALDQLKSGCDEMHTACDQCADQFEQAEQLIKLARNVTMMIENFLKQCPEAGSDIIEALMKIYFDCCK